MDTRASPKGPGEKKGRGGLKAQPRPLASRRHNPSWHISMIVEMCPARNRLRMQNRAASSVTPAWERIRHPWKVPRRSQGSSTIVIVYAYGRLSQNPLDLLNGQATASMQPSPLN